jgi:hypothetical protein
VSATRLPRIASHFARQAPLASQHASTMASSMLSSATEMGIENPSATAAH